MGVRSVFRSSDFMTNGCFWVFGIKSFKVRFLWVPLFLKKICKVSLQNVVGLGGRDGGRLFCFPGSVRQAFSDSRRVGFRPGAWRLVPFHPGPLVGPDYTFRFRWTGGRCGLVLPRPFSVAFRSWRDRAGRRRRPRWRRSPDFRAGRKSERLDGWQSRPCPCCSKWRFSFSVQWVHPVRCVLSSRDSRPGTLRTIELRCCRPISSAFRARLGWGAFPVRGPWPAWGPGPVGGRGSWL